MYYQKLQENLFADIEYPQHITELIGTAQPWKDFIALPQDLKQKLSFPPNEMQQDPGYQIRSQVEGREDKEFFHAYSDLQDFVTEHALEGIVEDFPAIKTFFNYAAAVYPMVHQFALDIGKEIGKEMPELGALVESGKIRSALRFLHYTGPEDIDIIAAQHFDRSLYTLHLYESDAGLQFLNWNMEWTDAPIDNGKTAVFSGYRMEQLTQGKLQKTWHRVIRKNKQRNRISLVLFLWADEIPSYNQEKRSRDLEPSYIKI